MRTGLGLAAALPTFDNDQMADYLVEGFWQDFGEQPRRFNLGATGAGAKAGALQYYLGDLTPAAEAMARTALELYAEILGIPIERAERQSSRVDLRFTDNQRGAGTQAYLHDSGAVAYATINVEAAWLNRNGDRIGDYSFLTYIHEIGHALGLGHAGAYDGYAVYVSDTDDPNYGVNSNISLNESWQMTMMSYLSQDMNPTVAADRAIPLTPMIADLAALERMYGPSEAYSGDTVWGFGTTIQTGPYALLAELADRNAFVILDRGGADLLDLSGFADDQRIDLRPETYSDVAGLVGNMGIARGVMIEKLRLGPGDDVAIGNGAANDIDGGSGDDVLSGGARSDILRGGPGADELSGGPGDDRLFGGRGADILDGGPGRDMLTGDRGADLFRFAAYETVRSDRIVADDRGIAFDAPGRAWGDRIDLSAIDADPGIDGRQPLQFGGYGAGRVWLQDQGEVTVVRAMTSGRDPLRLHVAIEDGAWTSADYHRADFIL